MKSKHLLRMSIKDVSSDGSFEGALAVYGNVDLGGDLIEPGAFRKTLAEHGDQVPLLWQHKSDKPIGMLSLIDGPDALRVKGQLLLDVPDARNAYLLIKARIVRGLSIGFDTLKDSVDAGVRHLKEIRLWEGSIVTFPMNEMALITSVKARKEVKEDFDTEFAEIQLQDQAYQMWIALRSALCSIPWTDLTREEKITASQASLDQFAAAYMAFIPAYLDWLAEEYGAMEVMSRKRLEHKSGRKLSAATKKDLEVANGHAKTAMDHCKSANDYLTALLEDEAADDDEADTSKRKAAITPAPEPVEDHSAAQSLVEQIRSLIPAA